MLASFRYIPSLALAFAFTVSGCSTGTVTVDVTRWAGLVDRMPVKIYLMNIGGESSEEFRKELMDELKANRRFVVQPYGAEPSSVPQDSVHAPALVLSGDHETRAETRMESEKSGEKTKNYKVTTDVDEFHYQVEDAATGEFLGRGTVAHYDVSKEEERPTSFLGSILEGIAKGVGESLLGITSARRKHTIRDLIASLLVHEEHRMLDLYKDGDLPELKRGIAHAEKGNWSEAIRQFQACAETHPEHENLYKAYYNLGVAYEFNLEFEKALVAFDVSYKMMNLASTMTEIDFCRQFQMETAWRERFRTTP